MKRSVLQSVLFLSFLSILSSCSDKEQFTIKGTIENGSGKTLYLENIGTSSISMIDSVKPGKDGKFKLKGKNPSEAPEFYRIRLNNQFINLAVDSTETIEVLTDTLKFARDYTVNGSWQSENIKQLTQLQLQTNGEFRKAQKEYKEGTLSDEEYLGRVQAIISSYKEKASQYIIPSPGSASAYFALFQQIDEMLIYDPYNRDDLKLFGAVANNWNQSYPDAPRTKHLIALYSNARAATREQEPIDWQTYEKATIDVFDFSLRSYDNKEIKLSDVVLGKITLLDFTAYELSQSPEHNLDLMEIYEKYHSKGFEIFQVSLDSDEHFWKNVAVNLPWTCVIDPQSVYSEIARKYNVQQIPCAFIISKEGDIVKRIEDFSNLEKEIISVL